MIPVLSKPVDQIGVCDLQAFIDSQVPESDQIEFKETLPTRDGAPDRWITHRDGIGGRARNEILEEAAAFANAYGGALLLGIRESKSRPPIAAEISPIPRCADLAERLKLVFRDCVEPQIPVVEVFAIPTTGDCGVVVVRTGRSRIAPHRVKPTRKCPIRRSDRCEEMTMREIQDLTLNLSRGLERLERQFDARSKRFEKEFERLTTPDHAWGIRATAAPVGEDIRFDRVYGSAELYGSWRRVFLVRQDGQEELGFPAITDSWRPMLRAARADHTQGQKVHSNRYREIHCDGMVELGLVHHGYPPSDQDKFMYEDWESLDNAFAIQSEWPLSMFANLVVWADRVRTAASTPVSEYALDIAIYLKGEYVPTFYAMGGIVHPLTLWEGPLTGCLQFPRYSLGDSSEVPVLLTKFEEDYWNCFGRDISSARMRKLAIEGYP